MFKVVRRILLPPRLFLMPPCFMVAFCESVRVEIKSLEVAGLLSLRFDMFGFCLMCANIVR